MTSTPCPADGLGLNGTHQSYYKEFNPCLPDTYANGQPLPCPVGWDRRGIGAYCHGDPSAFPSLPGSSNKVHLRYPIYSNTTRCRQPARAIEYYGLWIDEAELQQGLAEPNGNISVYPCRWEDQSPCRLWVKGVKSCINLHIQKWHGGKPGGNKVKTDCRWSGCGMVMQRQSIARHIVTVHLGEVWECQGCGKEITRNDAYEQHAARSNFEDCRTSGALVTYSAGARVVNTRTALDGGGKLRYASV